MPYWPQELFMRTQKKYFVYIMTNRSKTVYTGLTNSLVRRVRTHKLGIGSGFTAKYRPAGVLRPLPGCPQCDRARERNQRLAENRQDRVDRFSESGVGRFECGVV